ncbi:hypothetical protein OGM84_02780 [Pediococcus acidilactici]
MALTELVNGTKLPKQIISTALGVSRLYLDFIEIYQKLFMEFLEK